jgi:AcrR family transcriptional regulator
MNIHSVPTRPRHKSPPPVDKRGALLAAALELFTERTFDGTAMPAVAERAGVGVGTIYRYFPSKEQLALDLFLRHHQGLAEALAEAQRPAKGLRAKIETIVRCYCEWADRDWTLFAYHLLNQHSFLIQVPDDMANPVTVVRDVISQAMKAGEIPKRNIDLVAASAIGVVMQAATYKVYGRFTGDLSDHVRFFADAAWAVLAVKEK